MNKEKVRCLDSEDDDDDVEAQRTSYVPTGDAYMVGIRNNIAEQI